MNEIRRQAILIDLIGQLKESGSWTGETHVQKCVYFLQEGLGVPLGFEFFLYKHGPFSFELRDELGSMLAQEILNSKPRTPYGDSLAPGDDIDHIMKLVPKTIRKYHGAAEYVAREIAPQGVGVVQLERLGTALYVMREKEGNADLDDHQLAERMVELKPHLDINQAEQAVARVRKILARAPIVQEMPVS